MITTPLDSLLGSVVAGATPILFAAMGETLSEKSGVINLSLDGTILLSAMTSFAVAFHSGSVLLGFAAGSLTGLIVSAILATFSIFFYVSQVALGFVLTLTCRDLAYFLGNSLARQTGPQVPFAKIPFLGDIPFIGPVFFSHNMVVYFSLLLIVFIWLYTEKTRPGLILKSVGENPYAAYSRGMAPRKIRWIYTIVGGLLTGISGASFSLYAKASWGNPQGCEGTGWIALALVIFGGWGPLRVALGCYLFAFLQVMGIHFQQWFPNVPFQVFQVAPFPLMIFSLVVVNLTRNRNRFFDPTNRSPILSLLDRVSGNAPSHLGQHFRKF
jgi:simple sugar transport system permease protein